MHATAISTQIQTCL